MSVGIDIGTMNLVSARKEGDQIVTSRLRDAFLDLPMSSKKLLKLSGTDFLERGEELLIIGDAALEMANMFGREARRPLHKGLVSSSEMDALDVVGYMIKSLLGEPKEPNEVCYYSIPAAPIDNPDRDVIYHRRLFERVVREAGYTPVCGNEAMAIIYSEASRENFSGLALSFGSGMTNIAMSNLAVECMSFSVERGGDWIDEGAAKSIGSTAANVCAVKEKGIDLLEPKNRIEEAISFYYQELIEYVIDHVAAEFNRKKLHMTITKSLPVIVSGGTSLAKNFLPFFQKVLAKKESKLPFKILITRTARSPLNAVAQGLLIQAMQED
tara:strand:- start:2122 stop:3102 length:981 start_codon:yes stop_codon:yes gene_type:complete